MFVMAGSAECADKCSAELGPVGSELALAAQGRRSGRRELLSQATRGQDRRTDPRSPSQRGPLRPQGGHRPHHGHRGDFIYLTQLFWYKVLQQ